MDPWKAFLDLEVIDTFLIVSERSFEPERTSITGNCLSRFVTVGFSVEMWWTLTSEVTALKMLK